MSKRSERGAYDIDVPPRPAIPASGLILALVLAAECMDLLDGTIVNVAAPTIRTDLHASTAACSGSSAATRWPSPSA